MSVSRSALSEAPMLAQSLELGGADSKIARLRPSTQKVFNEDDPDLESNPTDASEHFHAVQRPSSMGWIVILTFCYSDSEPC